MSQSQSESVSRCSGHSQEETDRYLQAVEDEIENEERQTLKEWYGERGMECIGVGDARVVFGLCAEHVLKVNYNEEIYANREEAVVWERASQEMREWLSPIFDYSLDEGWLLMGRCEEYTGPRPPWLSSEVKALFPDALEGNLGVYQGRVGLLDYPVAKSDLAEFLDRSMTVVDQPAV